MSETPLMNLVIEKENLTYEDIEPYLKTINQQNDKGYTASILAVMKTSIKTVKLLLKHGADPNIKDIFEMTPIMWALAFENDLQYDMLKLLLENGANIDAQDICGTSVLSIAVGGGVG